MEQPFPNALINESSPYLLQHAHNPVQWYPWSETALQKAKDEDKPILVSIGYAACHWCHVMERESFEDREVAAFMNEHFINIKIDREERPDLDNIYMDAVQAMTGSGGWPLNVFLTTTARPFFGGTYFPPKKASGRSSWTDVLHFVSATWNNRRQEVEEQAAKLLQHVQSTGNAFKMNKKPDNPDDADLFSPGLAGNICETILKHADLIDGGFGKAPKFPQTNVIQYLISYHHYFKHEKALEHALHSLRAMLNGGIYDQLAGGMSRYSTDNQWLAPHFEKMLYDNALLVIALCDAYQVTRDESFRAAIDKTLFFCHNELEHKDGGFYAALDADSDGVEGKFYVWDKSEIDLVLGEDAPLFCAWYGVTEAGNWEEKNILHCRQEKNEFVAEKGITAEHLDTILSKAEKKLMDVRKKRNRPITDDKILLGWNALLLTAFCRASAALGEEKYTAAAVSLYHVIKDKFADQGKVVYHSYTNGQAKHPAFLDDYACFIQGCIQLHELTGNHEYLFEAEKLTRYVLAHFLQVESGMFYFTHENQEDVIVRKIEIHDGATPSGNSIMAENLFYLSIIFDQQEWRQNALKMLSAMVPLISKHPVSFAMWGNTFLRQVAGYIEIVITGDDAEMISKEVRHFFLPNKVLIASNVEKNIPILSGKKNKGTSEIHVCRDFTCFPPVTSISEFKGLLKIPADLT